MPYFRELPQIFALLGFLIEERHRISLVTILTARTSNPIMRKAYCTPSSHRVSQKSRNINRVSIGSGVRHPLRADSPFADLHSEGNLGLSACGYLTRIVVTCANILTSQRSSMGHPFAFTADANTLLPLRLSEDKRSPQLRQYALVPIICGAESLDE